MSSQSIAQSSRTVRNTTRGAQLIGLGLLSTTIALFIAIFAAPAGIPRAPLARPAVIDPAAQSVLAYLEAHRLVAQPVVVDAATQAVNSYLRAHSRSAQAAPIDPATQAVNDYLRAHSR